MGQLFDRLHIDALASELGPLDATATRALNILARLRDRYLDGTIPSLTESRVEQSFEEQLFAEVFGYRTLLRDGYGQYHLRVKSYCNGLFDDFSLGFYGPAGDHSVVTAELKSPGCDLDAPQNRTPPLTPVQQAHGTAAGDPNVEWILVSNFDEIRLYRKGSMSDYESLRLTEIDTVHALQCAYALFGKESLLGGGHDPAPLARAFQRKAVSVLEPHDNYLRLTHEASVSEAMLDAHRRTPLAVHAIDDALRSALDTLHAYWGKGLDLRWPDVTAGSTASFDGDRLIIVGGPSGDGRATRIEALPSGIVRVQEHVGIDSANNRTLQADDLAIRLAAFTVFAKKFFSNLSPYATSSVRARWILDDLDGSQLGHSPSWAGGHLSALKAEGVARVRSPWEAYDFGKGDPDITMRKVLRGLKEIAFPFAGRQRTSNTIFRLRPSEADIRPLVDPVLKLL